MFVIFRPNSYMYVFKKSMEDFWKQLTKDEPLIEYFLKKSQNVHNFQAKYIYIYNDDFIYSTHI